jgi:hypothetical protein
MARKNINLGTNANDGTGDKLRDAMVKVNDNFIELYEASVTASNISITNTTITTTSISEPDLLLQPASEGDVNVVYGLNINTGRSISNVSIFSSNSQVTVPVFKVNSQTAAIEMSGLLTTSALQVSNLSTLSGNVQLGTNSANWVSLASSIQGDIVPFEDNTRLVGLPNKRFTNGYFTNLTATSINAVDSTITTSNVTILRVSEDTFLGDLLIRDNVISTGINNEDIEIRPFGNGNLQVATRVIIGEIANPIGDAILKAIDTVTDSYVQVVLQNLDPGTTSSTDLFIPRDDGNDEINFIDLGINSSAYYNPLDYPIHTPGSAYLYTSDSDIFIGTYTNNDVVLHAGSDADFSSIAMRIKGDTAHIILGPEDGSTITVDTGELLQINGDTRINGNLIIQDRIILSSVGEDGDVIGMIAIDNNYIYYCTADYDGSSNIWSRVALSSTPW